jgi:hypothetical protein
MEQEQQHFNKLFWFCVGCVGLGNNISNYLMFRTCTKKGQSDLPIIARASFRAAS